MSKQTISEADLVDQTARPGRARFLFIFAVLELLLLLAFVDQFCVSTVLPYIGESLDAAASISWVGTAAIVTTIGSQMIVARCSDIFGRRPAFVAILVVFIVGNVLCGFAQTAIWLFTCRGLSGVGAGGIISLSMVCVADLVPVRERGKYQGYTGFMVALGSGMGPLIGAAMASRISWRWAFSSIPVLWFALPEMSKGPKTRAQRLHDLRKVDYLGSLLVFAASILILVPISGGGTLFPWRSATFGVLLAVGIACAMAFLLVERFVAPIPVLPPRLLRYKTVNLVLLATTTQGWIYYGLLFFVPLYLQEVLGVSALRSGVLLLPQVFSQGLALGLAGWFASRTGYIQAGFGLNLVGLGLMYRFDTGTSVAYIVGVLLLIGFSTGMTLQTTLVLMQADAPDDLRAVVTGARNTFRSFGGGLGLAAAGTIRNSLTASHLASVAALSPADRRNVVTLGVNALKDRLDAQTLALARQAVGAGIRGVFLSFLPLIACSCLAVCFVNHRLEASVPAPASDEAIVGGETDLEKVIESPNIPVLDQQKY